MILTWYRKNKRDLPWRKDRDPYHILVSEVMLQQTQVERVIPKYEEWMRAFPTIESLAKASTRDILLHWSGLGYNKRALYLKECAKVLVQNTQKIRSSEAQDLKRLEIVWPQTEKELLKLPGIGEYTARALLCFAFDKQIAVVDTNVRKVILTQIIYRHPEFISGSQEMLKHPKGASYSVAAQVQHDNKMIDKIADELLPYGHAYDWNQALMDYASQELKSQKITIPKQSKFRDSDRYYRGQILKYLLTNPSLSEKELQTFFPETVTLPRLEKIIAGMVKDRLLIEKDKRYFLE